MEKNYTCVVCDQKQNNMEFLFINEKCICERCSSNIISFNQNLKEIESNYSKETLSYKDDTPIELNFKEDVTYHPTEIKAQLDQYIVGQEKAKKVLSVACYSHYKRIKMNDPDIKKSNILLLGPTGSGKTYLVETLAKIINVPVAFVTATTLTEAGYIGDDVESIIKRLLDAADNDIERAERGIVFIDEVDKLVSSSSDTEKKVGGKGVQQALLKLLEGSTVNVPLSSSDPYKMGCKVEVNTSGILFICGGAFPDVEKIIERRLSKKATIGFNQSIERQVIDTNIIHHVTTEDLKAFGMIPEFLGRLPVISTMDNLSVEALKKILVEPKASIISQYKKSFRYDGVTLTFEDAALDLIAEKAFSQGTGARALRTILEEILLDLMYELPSKNNIDEVIITKSYIEGEEDPCYKLGNNNISAVY